VNIFKKKSTVLAIKEMEIKTTLRFHLTPVRMDIIKSTNNNEYWPGCGGKETSYTASGMYIITATMENSMEAPQKPKNRAAI
jgi:hypothetical protein